MIKRVDENGNVRLITNVRKPRKWRRFEYLLSSGALWIDTGIKTSIDTKFIATVRLTSPTADSKFIGAYIPGGVICTLLSKWRIYSGNTFYLTDIATNTNKVNIEFSENIFKVNDSSYTLGLAMAASNVNIFLFLADYRGDPTGGDCAIYEYKHYEGDLLVRHMVPAEYNGEYGMWDLVEDKFYPNKGTGTFTVGPEMKNYDEIYEVRKTTSLLPSGVELYDYILSSGTLYIDTNYNTSSLLVVYKWGAVDMNTNGSTSLFGSERSSSPKYSGILHGNRTSRSLYIGSSTSLGISYNSNDDNKHDWELNINLGTVSLRKDSNLIKSLSYSGQLQNTVSIGIFCNNGMKLISKLSLYYFLIYDNNQLVRNLIPCTYLGEPGMWDTVENKFYRNQGTGLFTLGNKITLKEFEYLLDATGTYINTGINVTQTSGFDLKMSFSATPTAEHIFFGSRAAVGYSGNNNYCLESKATGRLVFVGPYSGSVYSNTGNSNTLVTANTPYLLQYNNGNFTIDNNSQEMIGTILNINYPIYIFVANAGGNYDSYYTHKVTNKLYYCKLYENNQLVRDFIPVSYNGTPGLWDKVEWKFYANAGSGSFTLGPEKASGIYPVSYLYDRNVYEEPDGSKWLRIVHHNNPSANLFTSSDSFTTYVHKNENLWFDASWCNTLSTWELLVKLKNTVSESEVKYRWILSVNPITATWEQVKPGLVTNITTSGYTNGGNGGLYVYANSGYTSYTYMVIANSSKSNWYGAFGAWAAYQGGIPGYPNSAVTTGYLDLYIRIA